MQKETDIESLIVRNYRSLKWKTLVALLLCVGTTISIIVQITSKSFWIHFKPLSVYYFTSLALMVLGIIYYSKSIYYDKWVQLKIDKEGIWTPKYKTWLWNDIWYFCTSDERDGDDRVNFLQIKLKDGMNDEKNSLLLPLDNYDKSKEEIRSIMEKYAALHDVKDLGNNVVN